MVGRVLRGRNPNTGVYGFWVSKPGFDVLTANVMQMAFSSDYIHPKVVVKGTAAITPVAGPGPYGSGLSNGASESVLSIPYGATFASAPAAYMIATAPDWTLTLTNNNSGLTYLNNIWHTQIMETCFANTNIGDYWPGKTLKKDGVGTTDHLNLDWYSARVIIIPFTDHVEIRANCKSTVTVKYLVLENQ